MAQILTGTFGHSQVHTGTFGVPESLRISVWSWVLSGTYSTVCLHGTLRADQILTGSFHVVPGPLWNFLCCPRSLQELPMWSCVLSRTFRAVPGHYGSFPGSPVSLQELSMRTLVISRLFWVIPGPYRYFPGCRRIDCEQICSRNNQQLIAGRFGHCQLHANTENSKVPRKPT